MDKIYLYHLNSSFQNMTNEQITSDSQNIVNNYLRTRIINLKQIISRIQSRELLRLIHSQYLTDLKKSLFTIADVYSKLALFKVGHNKFS